MKIRLWWIVAGVAGLGAVGLIAWRAKSTSAAGVGQSIGSAAVDLVGGVLGGVADATGISSPANPVYSTVNKAGASVTGEKSFSLGSWLFEALNPDAVAAENAVLSPSGAPPVDQSIMDPRDAWARAASSGGSGAAPKLTPDASTPGAYIDPLTGINYGS